MKVENVEIPQNELGLYIQKVRKEIKWTQEELGRKVGLGKSGISKIESGKTKLTVDDARILLEVMGRKLEMDVLPIDIDVKKKYKSIIGFANLCVRWYAEQNKITLGAAYSSMLNYKALSFLNDNYVYESTLPKEIILEDIKTIIQRNMKNRKYAAL